MKSIRIISLLLAITALLAFSGCDALYSAMENIVEGEEEQSSPKPEDEIPEVPVDPNWPATAFGKEIPSAPEKVAVASAALAEYIFDMGLSEKVCAIPEFCGFPGAGVIPDIGSVSLPDLDTIEGLAPEYILTFAQYEESVLIEIQQMDITVIVIDSPESLDELRELFREIGIFFGGAEDGKALGGEYIEKYDSAIAAAAYSGEKAAVGFLRALDYTFITGDSMESEFLSELGLLNAAEEHTGYEIPQESFGDFNPEVLFVNSHIHLIDLETSDLYKKKTAVKGDRVFNAELDVIGICSLRSIEGVKDMLATVYPDYTLGTALEPAYPSMYS